MSNPMVIRIRRFEDKTEEMVSVVTPEKKVYLASDLESMDTRVEANKWCGGDLTILYIDKDNNIIEEKQNLTLAKIWLKGVNGKDTVAVGWDEKPMASLSSVTPTAGLKPEPEQSPNFIQPGNVYALVNAKNHILGAYCRVDFIINSQVVAHKKVAVMFFAKPQPAVEIADIPIVSMDLTKHVAFSFKSSPYPVFFAELPAPISPKDFENLEAQAALQLRAQQSKKN